MAKSIIAVAALAAALAAQNKTVVPGIYATTEASSATAYPFGLTTTGRVQYLYDASLVAVPVMTIKTIATRGNGGVANPAKPSVDLGITMSNTPVSPWEASTTFAANHGDNVTACFTRKLIDLPPQPATPTPAPFVTQIPLDLPFACDMKRGNLLLDYVIHSPAPGTYSHDTSFTMSPRYTPVGAPCGATQTVAGGLASYPGAPLVFLLADTVANAPSVHLLGLRSDPSGVPLPFSSCSLFQDVAMAWCLGTDATGTARIEYPLQYRHQGGSLNGQYVVLDSARSTLLASQSHHVLVGGFDPHTRIYHLTSATSATGTVQKGAGIVTELTY